MVYFNKLVAVIKCNGNIVREEKDIVNLPFNSEYSILIKNLSTNRAIVGVHIDGVDVLNNNKIIINSNSNHELFGFMNNNSEVTNRFKFIHKTENIVKYRGDRIDDGFINVSFQFEKQPSIATFYYYHPVFYRSNDFYTSYSSTLTNDSYTSCCGIPTNDEGITVKGSIVNHQYTPVQIGELYPEKHNIVLRLKGLDNTSQPIIKPLYTNTKLTCSTCGRKNKSNMKFCPECGTSLI